MAGASSLAKFAIDLLALGVITASLYFVSRQKPTGHPYTKGLLIGFHVIFGVVVALDLARTLNTSPGVLQAYALLVPSLILLSVAMLSWISYSIRLRPAGKGFLSLMKEIYTSVPDGPLLAALLALVVGTDAYVILYRPYTIVTLTGIGGSQTIFPAFNAEFLYFAMFVLLLFLYPTYLTWSEARRTKDRATRRALLVLPVTWVGIGLDLLIFDGYFVSLGYDYVEVGYVLLGLIFGLTATIFRRTSTLSDFFEPLPAQAISPSANMDSGPLDAYAPVLLMVDPTASSETVLADVARSKVSAGNLVYVFTSKGSPLHYALSNISGVRFYLFSTAVTYATPTEKNNELLVPQSESSITLDLLDKTVSTARKAPITIIFDSISDQVLYLGPEATYKFLKQAQQILVPPNLTSVYILTMGAQDERTLNLVMSMFRMHAVLDPKGLRVTKGSERELARGSEEG